MGEDRNTQQEKLTPHHTASFQSGGSTDGEVNAKERKYVEVGVNADNNALQEDNGAGENGEDKQKASHQMVDVDKQPGRMQYPYATHGPAPENSDNEENEGGNVLDKIMDGDSVSAPFVLGVIIVAAVLFVGLMLASQRRQMNELEGRIEHIESYFEILDQHSE